MIVDQMLWHLWIRYFVVEDLWIYIIYVLTEIGSILIFKHEFKL